MIRVGVDATSVAPEGKGISRVQLGTVRALAELGRFELVVFARHPELLDGARRVALRPTIAWEQLGLARTVREVDVLLTWTERLPLLGPGRFVVWLFEPPTHRIEQNRRVGPSRWQRASDLVTLGVWKRSLRRARVVLTGSRATAEAIADVVPARPLYPGLDPRFSPGDSRDDYVFHLASDDPRDDTPTAVAAAERAGVRLVVAGGRHGRVSDDELVELYRRASAFVDTSLYEGFGYQVLEAMACGAPVVASDTTSIPELVGDAGVLCPPGDVDAFASGIRRALAERDELSARGLRRAAEFTWERTARELADALEEAAR